MLSLLFFCPYPFPPFLSLSLLRDWVSLCSAGLEFIIGQVSLELRGTLFLSSLGVTGVSQHPQLVVLFHYSDVTNKRSQASVGGISDHTLMNTLRG